MTLTFDTAARKIPALKINTYMGESKDAVTRSARFAQLPKGSSHVLNIQATESVNWSRLNCRTQSAGRCESEPGRAVSWEPLPSTVPRLRAPRRRLQGIRDCCL